MRNFEILVTGAPRLLLADSHRSHGRKRPPRHYRPFCRNPKSDEEEQKRWTVANKPGRELEGQMALLRLASLVW